VLGDNSDQVLLPIIICKWQKTGMHFAHTAILTATHNISGISFVSVYDATWEFKTIINELRESIGISDTGANTTLERTGIKTVFKLMIHAFISS
jgi:hypothetical protein